jgi:hypothetical protein
MSLNILYGRRRDWMCLLLLQLCQNTIVCLCADWVPSLHRLLWNQFWMPSDSLHVLFLGTHLPLQHPHIDHSWFNQVIENSKYHFLDLNLVRNLPVFLLSKSTFWMWPLSTDTMAGHDKAFINNHSPVEHQCNHWSWASVVMKCQSVIVRLFCEEWPLHTWWGFMLNQVV